MIYRPPKRLIDLDLDNITNEELGDFIYVVDPFEGRRFRKVEGEVQAFVHSVIIRYLKACQRQDVLPDRFAFQEIIKDAPMQLALIQRARENVDTEKETDKDMGFKSNTRPKKAVIENGLSESNRLLLFVEPEFETTFTQWLKDHKCIRVCPASRAQSLGSLEPAFKNVWSVVKPAGFPRTVKKLFNSKIGKVTFQHFSTGKLLAQGLAEKVEIILTPELIGKLTPPPAPPTTSQPSQQPKEGLPMANYAQNVMDGLGDWIFSKAKPGQVWNTELRRLFDLSRSHHDFGFVGSEEFTKVALKALCGTPKAPSNAIVREIVYFYMEHHKFTNEDPVPELMKIVVDHRQNKPQESLIRLMVRDYEVLRSNSKKPVENNGTGPELVIPPTAATNLKDLIGELLGEDGSFPKGVADKAALKEIVQKTFPNVNPGSFDTTFSLVRRTKNKEYEAKMETEPHVQENGHIPPPPAPELSPDIPAAQPGPAPTPIIPEGKLTIRTLVKANLNPDGSLPSHCATRQEFYHFLHGTLSMTEKSCENAMYAVRHKLKSETAAPASETTPQDEQPAAVTMMSPPPVIESEHEPEPESDLDPQEKVAAEMRHVHDSYPHHEPGRKSAVEVAMESGGESLFQMSERPAPPPIEKLEEEEAVATLPRNEELERAQQTVKKARVIFTRLDENPSILATIFEFRKIRSELEELSDIFAKEGDSLKGGF